MCIRDSSILWRFSFCRPGRGCQRGMDASYPKRTAKGRNAMPAHGWGNRSLVWTILLVLCGRSGILAVSYTHLKRLFAFFSYLPEYGSPILARIHLDIGLSPSGKATDFDSVIPLVRIQPAQPRRSKLCIACSDFFVKIRAHTRRYPRCV